MLHVVVTYWLMIYELQIFTGGLEAFEMLNQCEEFHQMFKRSFFIF